MKELAVRKKDQTLSYLARERIQQYKVNHLGQYPLELQMICDKSNHGTLGDMKQSQETV